MILMEFEKKNKQGVHEMGRYLVIKKANETKRNEKTIEKEDTNVEE